jgi:hypothetical protein
MSRMAWFCQSSVMVLYRVILNQHPMIVPSSAEKLKVSYLGVLLMVVHGSASTAALALSFKVPYPLGGSQRNVVMVVAGKSQTCIGQGPQPAKERK